MIERKDGETDASWIGRLEAAYKALIPACEKCGKERALWAYRCGEAHGELHKWLDWWRKDGQYREGGKGIECPAGTTETLLTNVSVERH
jgi:hypothetical protein